MHFIPLQKWYDIILCCHSNRRVQTLMVSWLWRRVIYGINLRVLVAMVTELCTHFILQWYETHTMLCNCMKCIPVLILKSQRHTFSQTNNFSQINKFFVICRRGGQLTGKNWFIRFIHYLPDEALGLVMSCVYSVTETCCLFYLFQTMGSTYEY